MGFGNNGRLTDEKSPVTLDNMIGDYKRSKFMAEQLVIEAGTSGQNVVMVNPTTPVGERDIKPTPSGQIVVDFLRRKFPGLCRYRLNLVDVVDCAEGHLLAMEKAQPGERYILGGENLTLKQILDKLGAITGLPSPKVKLPYAVALATGVVDTVVVGKMLKREPRVTIDAVRMGARRCSSPAPRPNASWDGIRGRWTRPCGARWSGSGRTAMPRKPIAIVAAMPVEAGAVCWARSQSQARWMASSLFELPKAVVAVGGIGEKFARHAAEVVD